MHFRVAIRDFIVLWEGVCFVASSVLGHNQISL
jgi:hypothetical protein